MAQELKLNKEKEKLESHQSDVNVVDYFSNNLNPSGQMMGVPGNTPLVIRVDLSAARQSQLAAIDELNKFKEQVASMVKNKFGVDMGSSRLYQKPYKAEFDLMAYPLVGAYLILLN
jgi:hypothetical protein